MSLPVNNKKIIKGYNDLSKKEWLMFNVLIISNILGPIAFSCIAPFFNDVALSKGAILSPIIGKLIGKLGVHYMYTYGCLVTGFSTLLFSITIYLPTKNTFFIGTLIIRLFQSLGRAMFYTTTFSIVSIQFPDITSSMLGYIETVSGLGYNLGPVIGGIIYDMYGYEMLFIILGPIIILNGICAYYYIENKPIDEKKIKLENFQKKFQYKKLFKMTDIYFLMIITMICGFFFCYNEPTLPIALKPFNMSHTQIGTFFLIQGMVFSIFAPIWGLLLDHLPITNMLLFIGNILLTISLFLFGPASFIPFERTPLTIGIASVIQVSALAACYVPCFKQSMYIITEEYGYPNNMNTNGILSGIFTCVFSLGGFIGPTIGGILVQYYQYTIASTIIGYAHCVFVVIFIVFYIIPRFFSTKKNLTENTATTSFA
ncbi:MFS-type transporter SLC18B1 [Strongyloides ratti]|uniref:MFS-type transporter SLC18B1 n=1 Tax=Strongyloides ratti TaxID=34506 RepID=A0A090LCT7_STRRB|nr:MFS-type transporter SLC18B1 [Strongyloides ratti]CEF65310.1 MFS-type transporter SLC18B1 [Strongyloides ratti]